MAQALRKKKEVKTLYALFSIHGSDGNHQPSRFHRFEGRTNKLTNTLHPL